MNKDNLPNAIIVDVDGTLAYKCDRDIFDYSKVEGDIPNNDLIYLLGCIESTEHYLAPHVFILTGREDSSREHTEKWLYDNDIVFDELVMRKTGDRRADTIVKDEMYKEYIEGKYNIVGVFEDRPVCVRMWKEKGLFVLDCNRGDSSVEF